MSTTLHEMASDLMPSRWNISANEKHVLAQLGRMADNDTDDCYPSLDYIGARTGLHEDTVRRCCRSLRDGGWLAIIPRERGNGASSSHLFRLNANQIVAAWQKQRDEEREKRMARAEAVGLHGATLPPRTVQPGGLHGATPILTDNYTKDSLSDAREAWPSMEVDVREATVIDEVDGADWTSPGILVTYPLTVLLTANPPCTPEQIIAGVRKAAAWYVKRNLAGKMRNWDKAAEMAVEYRDAAVRGHPVREAPKPPPDPAAGDPSTWTRERWLACLKVAKRSGEWPGHWGAPPGAPGSHVPADLVIEWTGEAVS